MPDFDGAVRDNQGHPPSKLLPFTAFYPRGLI